MGSIGKIKGIAGFAVSAAGVAVVVTSAFAQTAPRPQIQPRPTLDLSALSNRIAVRPDDELQNVAVIDFENVQGPRAGSGIALANQYAQSHGVSFSAGVSVHGCSRGEFATTAAFVSLCPYPAAASGRRAALFDARAGGAGAMTMSFSKPVNAVSMRINPTGGQFGESFVVQMDGYNESGARIASDTMRFNYDDDAFTWPNTASLKTDQGGFARVTAELRRAAQNNQAVRFLFDDLTLSYAPEQTLSPAAEAIRELRRPPRVEAEVVQSPNVGDAQNELRLYPAAVRKRAVIDWDAVDEVIAQQNERGLSAAAYRGQNFVDAAELPLLLPGAADPGSVVVAGNRDSYTAYFTVGGLAHSLYGSRLLTVMTAAQGSKPDAANLTLMRADESLTGSFALFGASYSITRHCKNDSVEDDPDCHNADALGDVAGALVVVVGQAGRGRP